MPRLLGVELPAKKKIGYSLRYIYGIGPARADLIIEAAGLKGFRIGDIMVSPKHANFLVNVEAATAADVEKLVAHIQAVVNEKFGVALTPEFRIAGESL